MNREEVIQSIALKKRFCKDCNLPIAVFDNPYFYQRLTALDYFFDCIEKFEKFCDELKSFSTEQDYFAYYNAVKDKLINAIKGNAEFEKFCSETFNVATAYPKRDLYSEENDRKTFISIDMRKANFSALHHYSTSIFGCCDTWEEFVSTYTSNKHIMSSKYIRQVVLGACNPKRQIQYEKYLMNSLLNHIMVCLPSIKVYSLGEDEIIISVDGSYNFSLKQLRNVIKECPNGIGQFVRVEMFDLSKIDGTSGWQKDYYAFDNDSEKVEFKCLDAEIYHQIAKHYYGDVITKDDLVFYHNGQLARFLREVENPWQT